MSNSQTSSISFERYGWALPRDSRLVWSNWRSGHILYQVSSGETHYLNATGASVLYRLSDGPGTFAEICQHIAGTDGFQDDEVFIRQVADLLARFDELGLVTRHDFLADTA
jgi:PqqD family protein of HPr-rel-A system